MIVEMEELHYGYMDSPVGRLGLAASFKGLVSLDFLNSMGNNYIEILNNRNPGKVLIKDGSFVQEPLEQVREYFMGQRQNFTCSLDLAGTIFQKMVWQALREVPYGKTCSYEDIASKIDNNKAVRAVGQANGKNPIAIIVPCHRVIRKSGHLGGYSSGLDIKRFLLNWEEKILNV
ncbi:MAG: hypothetical protein VR72_17525 [Clostridiaceae bacterium BRH_c20a]|nr:MAG: hypothetical protein VR72_17525 [Clostridiaceae bacterium BRH_c20a]